MNTNQSRGFPSEVVAKLKTYVYRLIDPRDGETFYVGKGTGNRVFAHINDTLGSDGDASDDTKIRRIREIRQLGLEVGHVIHRHGMDDETAFEVESALIDAYPGLTNKAGGVGGNEFGAAHAQEIIRAYSANPAVFEHTAILISVNRSSLDSTLLAATQYAWKVDPARAAKAEVVLATVHGIIQGAFVAEKWLPANPGNFPGRAEMSGRHGFIGYEAPTTIAHLYVGKRVPDEYRRRGAANPIKYVGL